LIISSILSFFPSFAEGFGISFISNQTFFDYVIKVFVIIILFIISYGFSKLKRWGYYLMLTYNLFFLALGIILVIVRNNYSFYTPGYIPSLLGFLLTLRAKRYFPKKEELSQIPL